MSNGAVPVACRFLTSGSFQNIIGDITRVHQLSVSRAINGVIDALYRKRVREIKMPGEPA